MSIGVTKNSGAHAKNLPEQSNTSLAKPQSINQSINPPWLRASSSVPLLQLLTWRPTWSADQPAHLASARQPGGPVHPWAYELPHSVYKTEEVSEKEEGANALMPFGAICTIIQCIFVLFRTTISAGAASDPAVSSCTRITVFAMFLWLIKWYWWWWTWSTSYLDISPEMLTRTRGSRTRTNLSMTRTRSRTRIWN